MGSGAPGGFGVLGVAGCQGLLGGRVSECKGFLGARVSGCQAFLGGSGSCRNRSYKPTARVALPGFRVVELCATWVAGIE